MRYIPRKIKDLVRKNWPPICLNCGSQTGVEWHHALFYAGKQINEWYAIVPLCPYCHRGNNGDIFPAAKRNAEIMAIYIGLANKLEENYPRFDWRRRLKFLLTYPQKP